MREYIQMIAPQQHGHYYREDNQEFFSGKPQDEHACQQGQEQDDNAEPEKDAYRNVHVHNRFAYIDLIEAYAICRTADYIQYDREKYFHVISFKSVQLLFGTDKRIQIREILFMPINVLIFPFFVPIPIHPS